MNDNKLPSYVEKVVAWADKYYTPVHIAMRWIGVFFLVYPTVAITIIGHDMNWEGNIYLGPFCERVLFPMIVGTSFVVLSNQLHIVIDKLRSPSTASTNQP